VTVGAPAGAVDAEPVATGGTATPKPPSQPLVGLCITTVMPINGAGTPVGPATLSGSLRGPVTLDGSFRAPVVASPRPAVGQINLAAEPAVQLSTPPPPT